MNINDFFTFVRVICQLLVDEFLSQFWKGSASTQETSVMFLEAMCIQDFVKFVFTLSIGNNGSQKSQCTVMWQ